MKRIAQAAALVLASVQTGAFGAETLTDGAVVRVASDYVESGWHKGRAVLDARKCWMVRLERPTSEGYTLLALSFVRSVEAARANGWAALPLQAIIQSQPAACLEEGSD